MRLSDTFFPEHFSPKDRMAIFMALVFSSAALIALIKIKSTSEEKTKKVIAKIEYLSNNVRYKESGSVSFYSARISEGLQTNDEIFTGENSQASVRFLKTSTLLKIPSSSLIRIEENEDGDSIEVQDGVVDVIIAKNGTINLKSNGITHQIKSSKDESLVKAYHAAGKLHLFTKDKGIKVKTSSGEKEITPEVDTTAVKNDIIKVSPSFTVISPTQNEKIENGKTIKIITNFKDKYKVSISRNENFTPLIYTNKFNGTSLEWNEELEDGNYFLKIENNISKKIVSINLTTKLIISDIKPADNEIVTLPPEGKINLSWNSLPVDSYKVIVKDKSGTNTFITKSNQIQIGPLKGELIEWAILPEIENNKFKKLKSMTKINLNFAGKIDLVNLPKKLKYKLNDDPITLSWKGIPEEEFKVRVLNVDNNLEIFSSKTKKSSMKLQFDTLGSKKIEVSSVDFPGLAKAEFKYEVSSPILIWDQSLPKEIKSIEQNEEITLKYKSNLKLSTSSRLLVAFQSPQGRVEKRKTEFNQLATIRLKLFGNYCFKALPLDTLKYYFESDDYCINYLELPPFPDLPKAQDQLLSLDKHNGVDAYKIIVPLIKRAVKYRFEIYRDNSGKKMIYSANSTVPELFWISRRSGIYFLRYKVYDGKNRESQFSPFSKITFPISPLSEW